MNSSRPKHTFQNCPIVGILRGLEADWLRPVIKAAREGGLAHLEVTMNTPSATAQIRTAVDLAGNHLQIGAGTVTSLPILEAALRAGAGFIVTPTLAEPVIKACVGRGVPVFPGAFSPNEIVRAWELGATMVKVFPAEIQGPAYIRRLKETFPKIRLMPTGGVNLETIRDYARAGADAFGIGSPLFQPQRIASGDWGWLRNQCRALVEASRALE